MVVEEAAQGARHPPPRRGAVLPHRNAHGLVVGGLVIQTVKQAAVIGYALLAVLVTQITLGILNVVWVLPLLNATAHNTFGALLLLVLVTINFAPRLRIVQS